MRDGYLRGTLPRTPTARQVDVLAAFVATGGSVADAAARVGVKPSTAKRHLADLRARSGLTTEQLIYRGRAEGVAGRGDVGADLTEPRARERSWLGGARRSLTIYPPRINRPRMTGARNDLPLTPAVFHILLALSSGDRHGYAIMKEVATLSEGKLRLGPGTLYRSIKTMLASGLIEESEERPDPEVDDERRRYYRLTDFGQRVAQAEARRLHRLLMMARDRRLLDAPQTSTVALGGGQP